jgi:2'-5' RNA ligase
VLTHTARNVHEPEKVCVSMARLAVAVRLPAHVVEVLSALPRPATPRVTWSVPAQWIVKLRPLGHVDDRLVEPLVAALDDELDGVPPVRCVLGPATRRLGGQWLGAPVSGLDDLSATVFDATVGLVPVTHPQPFQADVVLARGRVPAALAGTEVAAEWVADEVVLIADRSAPHRPRLDDLARFPLPGPAR